MLKELEKEMEKFLKRREEKEEKGKEKEGEGEKEEGEKGEGDEELLKSHLEVVKQLFLFMNNVVVNRLVFIYFLIFLIISLFFDIPPLFLTFLFFLPHSPPPLTRLMSSATSASDAFYIKHCLTSLSTFAKNADERYSPNYFQALESFQTLTQVTHHFFFFFFFFFSFRTTFILKIIQIIIITHQVFLL